MPGVQELLRSAVALHQQGRLDDAERAYQAALALDPENAPALQLSGTLAAQRGDLARALSLLERAVALKADYSDAHNNRATVLARLGRREEALASAERAIALEPGYADAHNNRGTILLDLGRAADALPSFERACELAPSSPDAHCNRGHALRQLGRPREALDAYDRALAIFPRHVDSLYSRGNALLDLRRPQDALASYERALHANPHHADAHGNRGVALQQLGRTEEALESYRRAIELAPHDARLRSNLGGALVALGDAQAALPLLQEALRLRPDSSDAHNNAGLALQATGQPAQALASFERALVLRPDFVEAHQNLGAALEEFKRFEEAAASYARALALEPAHDYLYGTWLLSRMQVCDWSGYAGALSELTRRLERGERAAPPFCAAVLTGSPGAQRRAAETWVADKHPPNAALGPIERRAGGGRIRVAYYSSDYYEHATAYLAAELIERHDRARFEIVGISYGPVKEDAMRRRLAGAFDRFIDVRERSDLDVAKLSREMEIDIAVDLKGFTRGSRGRIFSYRAAPLQVSYLGFPGTSGAPYMDYLVADPVIVPEESLAHYSEKIVFLPGSYQVNDSRRSRPTQAPARSELGLPASAFVFCCFNNSFKITPEVFERWMRILHGVPESVLWLLEDTPAAAASLRAEAARRRIPADRLVFAPRQPLAEHLARHRQADLFLDTLPCNAHTTASDALWAGVPVLTCAGSTFAGRVAASLLRAVGLDELVAADGPAYEALAIRLARAPQELAALKERLERGGATSALFDSARFTRGLESAYEGMWDRWRSGRPSDHIRVEGAP
ncbi:MAG: tetratricopeptide repeat protein [Clostridia bacterium]